MRYKIWLVNGDSVERKATNIIHNDAGDINGISYDSEHLDRKGFMAQDALWGFARGQWTHYERIEG